MQAYQRVLDALRAVPGVEAATAMFGLPPDRPPVKNNTRVADATIPSVGPFHIVDYYQYVYAGLFRDDGHPDRAGARLSASRCLVRGSGRGRQRKVRRYVLERTRPDRAARQAVLQRSAPWFTVVGVAKDVKQGGVDQETGTELYMSVQQVARPAPGLGFAPLNHVVLRTTLTPAALVADHRAHGP